MIHVWAVDAGQRVCDCRKVVFNDRAIGVANRAVTAFLDMTLERLAASIAESSYA